MTILHTALGFPTSGQSQAGFDIVWVNPSNIQAVSGEAVATHTVAFVASIGAVDYAVNLILGGTVGSENKASGSAWPSSADDALYGGATDLWSESPTRADLYDSETGIGLIADIMIDGTPYRTNRLKAIGWVWNPVIPLSATIVGLQALIRRRYSSSGGRAGTNVHANVQYIQMRAWFEVPDLNPHYAFP